MCLLRGTSSRCSAVASSGISSETTLVDYTTTTTTRDTAAGKFKQQPIALLEIPIQNTFAIPGFRD